MARQHITTHPVIGPATWQQMVAARDEIVKRTGVNVCTWCHKPVSGNRRSRCGDPVCTDRIFRAYSWNHCRIIALRAAKHRCALCGNASWEVDHIVPVCRGGTGDASNLRALCSACHQRATNELVGELSRERRSDRNVAGPGQLALEDE